MTKIRTLCLTLVTTILAFVPSAQGATTRIAVATNFSAPAKALIKAYEAKHPHKVKLSLGSTGKLYAQIINGAPFELFLSADSKTPQKLINKKLAVTNSDFTYAKGKIVLYSLNPNLVDSKALILHTPEHFNKLAIANPKIAPYGQAAFEVLTKLNAYSSVKHKLIKGDNIAQTYQFVSTGNSQLGFIAASQLKHSPFGSIWFPDETLYSPILQDAVLLNKGKNNPAALSFLNFLQSSEAKEIITLFNYEVDKG